MVDPPADAAARRSSVDRSLRFRVRIYLLIFVIALVVAVVDVVRIGADAVLPVVVAFVLAVAVGLPVSRMFALTWDTVNERVVGRIDAVGAAVLVVYILISVFRTRLVELWFDGPLAVAAGVAVLAGLMLGQVIGTGRGVRRVLSLATTGTEPGPAATPRLD